MLTHTQNTHHRVDAKRAELQAELERADAEERMASVRQWRSRRESSHAAGESVITHACDNV